MKSLLIDFEYNNIRSWQATKVWCASTSCIETGVKKNFHPKTEGPDSHSVEWRDEFREYLKEFDFFIAHNYWMAEAVILDRFFDFKPDPIKCIDTLALSRALRPSPPDIDEFGRFKKNGWDTRLGGHSVEAWGQRMGLPKIEFDDFQRFTFDQMVYCERDVDVNVKMFHILLKEAKDFGYSQEALQLEQDAHRILIEQQRDGFKLDKARAKKLVDDTALLIEKYTAELQQAFPPKKIFVENYVPRYYKDRPTEMVTPSKKFLATRLHEQKPDGSFDCFEMQEFNPHSPQQVGMRLVEMGWNPRKFTPTGQPATSKDVIGEAIDFLAQKVPQVEVLRKFNIVSHRNSTAREWLNLADAEKDGRVRGSCNHIGPWTHRCSHYEPNMANISKVSVGADKVPIEGLPGNFGWDSRHCWIPEDGWKLIGCDAAGIQLRALAHYMADPEFIVQVCEGDVHVVNQKAAGITKGYAGMSPRDVAKRFIYAWLLGAGDEKVGIIVGTDPEEYQDLFSRAQRVPRHVKQYPKDKRQNLLWWVTEKLKEEGRWGSDDLKNQHTAAVIIKGHLTKKKFLENTPALKRFKEEEIRQAARDGFMKGLDGRIIWVPSEHLAMGAYLQGFEATIMKWAMVHADALLKAKGVPFRKCAMVHDEWQWEAPPEHADLVGKTLVESIVWAGEHLNSKCPLAGEYRIGDSWALTH